MNAEQVKDIIIDHQACQGMKLAARIDLSNHIKRTLESWQRDNLNNVKAVLENTLKNL